MNREKRIKAAVVSMLQGRKMTVKQIRQYEQDILQAGTDDRVEAMMLYMAEALHDIAGYGMTRTKRILKSVDDHMQEWLDPGFSLDDLRVRVFEKTNFMFACDAETQKHVAEVLRAAGYHVDVIQNE